MDLIIVLSMTFKNLLISVYLHYILNVRKVQIEAIQFSESCIID